MPNSSWEAGATGYGEMSQDQAGPTVQRVCRESFHLLTTQHIRQIPIQVAEERLNICTCPSRSKIHPANVDHFDWNAFAETLLAL